MIGLFEQQEGPASAGFPACDRGNLNPRLFLGSVSQHLPGAVYGQRLPVLSTCGQYSVEYAPGL